MGDTGLEVFEIIRKWLGLDRDWGRLTEAYHWLPADDLQAALAFDERNPAIVDARLDEERRARVEDIWAAYPDSKPAYR